MGEYRVVVAVRFNERASSLEEAIDKALIDLESGGLWVSDAVVIDAYQLTEDVARGSAKRGDECSV